MELKLLLPRKMKKRSVVFAVNIHKASISKGSSIFGWKSNTSNWTCYGLVAIASALCYFNGLTGEFVHDDIPAVRLNRDVLGTNPLVDTFKNDFWGTPMVDVNSHKSYRPLTTLTFRLNYILFGFQPIWWHLTNLLIHIWACILFTRVCTFIAGFQYEFATMAGILFAVHPIHTEAVTGIVGRADVLACAFFLSSILVYHSKDDERCQIHMSIVYGSLSMLAKETGIMVFVFNIIYDIYKTWSHIRKFSTNNEAQWNDQFSKLCSRITKLSFTFCCLLAIRLVLLQGSFPKFSQQDNPAAFHPSIYVRLLTFSYLAAFNWWLILYPAMLSHDWQMGSVPLITSLNDARNLITLFFFGTTIFIVYKCLVNIEDQRHLPLALGLFLLVLPFLPAANLVITVGFVIAERVLYIPSLGSVLIAVYGVQTLWQIFPKHRQVLSWFIGILLISGVLRSVVRNTDWQSRETLLRAGLKTLPQNAKMHYNFANFLRETADIETKRSLALVHYKEALRLWPSYSSAHNNLGTLLSNKSDAEMHFLMAIKHSKDHVNAHYNLGHLYRLSKRFVESKEMLERCIQIEPRYTAGYMELVRLHGFDDLQSGSLLAKVARLHPKNPFYLSLYADWLYRKGGTLRAIALYGRSLAITNSYKRSFIGIIRCLRKIGQKSRILQMIQRWKFIQNVQIRHQVRVLGFQLYLHSYHLRNQLIDKVKEYDDHPCANKPASCIWSKTTGTSELETTSNNKTKESAQIDQSKLQHIIKNNTFAAYNAVNLEDRKSV